MIGRVLSLLFLILFFLGIEFYTYFGIKSIIPDKYYTLFSVVYLVQFAYLVYALFAVNSGIQNLDVVRSSNANFMVGVLLTSVITKLVFVGLLFLQDGGRLFWGVGTYVTSFFYEEINPALPSRRKFITTGAAFIATIPFSALLYGLTSGKYKFTVKDVNLSFDDLPPNFHGLKIVQLSDIHAGSFDDLDEVARGIDLVNEQNPDVILLTGDLVNASKDEINPYIELFSRLKARYGKYIVLGNHDYYGIRARRGSLEYREYMQDFEDKIKAMGFHLLNNESTTIEINGESISIAGVENWGAARYVQKYGDLDKALSDQQNESFKILMSHDPTHWDEKVINHEKKVQLTLSGHTHGMQFGIDIPWLKWSPVKYRYKRWMGLYEENGRYLYVNRGFGFLGFPGRVGIWPEITKITLNSA